MNEDWLGLTDPQERRDAQGPAYLCVARLGDNELRTFHDMSRRDTVVECGKMVFTTEREDGVEELEEAETWRSVLGWDQRCRVPTLDEVLQFQTSMRTARIARWFDRLAAARALDEQPSPPSAPFSSDEANSPGKRAPVVRPP